VLEPVEHLLERELHTRENSAVAAGDLVGSGRPASERKHSDAGCDQKRQMCDDEPETQEPAKYAARTYEKAAEPDPSRAALMDIRVQPDHHARGINGQHRR